VGEEAPAKVKKTSCTHIDSFNIVMCVTKSCVACT